MEHIQGVVGVDFRVSQTPFTRYSRLSSRLYNQFDNRLYRVNKHPTGCQTSCQTRLTTGLTTVLNQQHCSFNRVEQPVVKPGCTTGLTTGCIHDTTGCQTDLTTAFTTGCIV